MPDLGDMKRFTTFAGVAVLTVISLVLIPAAAAWPRTSSLVLMIVWSWWFFILFAVFAVLTTMGVYDVTQTKHSILRNYPVLGHMRFFLKGSGRKSGST